MCLSGVCDRARCTCLVCVTGLDVLVWCVCDRAGCTCLVCATGLDVLCVSQGWMCLSGVCDRAGCACLVCATGLDVLVWCV